MTEIAIFDFGAGNLFNLHQSLLRNGAHTVDIIRTLNELENYDGLVLPGVGNFDSAISSIQKDSISLNAAVDSGMPILGICLGLEMLFNKSEEGILDGLKVLDGNVLMLPKTKVKVPHIGWNNLRIVKTECNLLKGIPQDSWVYFVHSFFSQILTKFFTIWAPIFPDFSGWNWVPKRFERSITTGNFEP